MVVILFTLKRNRRFFSCQASLPAGQRTASAIRSVNVKGVCAFRKVQFTSAPKVRSDDLKI